MVSVALTTMTPTAVGQDVLEDDPPVGRPGDPGRVDELPLPQGQELRPDQSGQALPATEAEREGHGSTPWASSTKPSTAVIRMSGRVIIRSVNRMITESTQPR